MNIFDKIVGTGEQIYCMYEYNCRVGGRIYYYFMMPYLLTIQEDVFIYISGGRFYMSISDERRYYYYEAVLINLSGVCIF